MRAIAILLVLLYHANVPGFEGGYVGVDMFFVISGFLITGTMLREIETTNAFSLSRFWARRAKRLLPAAFLALAGSAVITWLWLPVTQREVFGGDIIAASLYVVNWRLGDRSVDYLAEDVGSSPVQHFWSLAVEEQFYIAWPLFIVVALLVASRLRISRTAAVTGVVLVASGISFWWSVTSTRTEPAVAFFSTLTRFWELGIGAGLALGASMWTSLGLRQRAALAWTGLAAILYATVGFDESTAWPSWRALVPVGGAALLLVAGIGDGTTAPARTLSIRPAVWIGGLSYSLYLWHWPLLVGFESRFDGLTAPQAIGVVALSFAPAIAANRLVENPLRFARPMERNAVALGVGAVCVTASVAVGALLIRTIPPSDVPDDFVAAGAAAITEPRPPGTPTNTTSTDPDYITPDPVDAADDLPDAYSNGCQVGFADTEPRECVYGDSSTGSVMLVGDSKAVQWESALQAVASELDWTLTTIGKSSCAFSEADHLRQGEPYPECRAWNDAVTAKILDAHPDLVIVSSGVRAGYPKGADDTEQSTGAMARGYADRWTELIEAGIPVVVILDNPGPDQPIPECVADNRTDIGSCAFMLEAAWSAAATQRRALEMSDDAHVIDMTAYICPDDCPAVIGNVLVYRQGSHLTRTYIDSLAPVLADQLKAVRESIRDDAQQDS